MKNMLLFFAFFIVLDGVIGESVSVMEGDSVTLHTNLTEIQKDDVLQWRFGAEGARLAQINRGDNTSLIEDDQRFRLKLNNQTGDLTIRNIRPEDSGVYEVTSGHNLKKFNVICVPVDPVKAVSVLVGDSVTLNTDLTEIQRDVVIQWRYGPQHSPVAEINKKNSNIYKYDGPDERFKHRLQLNYCTGSLTISNTSSEHSGLYEVDIISGSGHTIHKSFNVTVRGEMRTMLKMEEESVTLQTDLTEIQTDDFIMWMFGDTILAKISKNKPQQFYRYDGADERFRGRLQLNNQTGSLTIIKCKTSNSGLYDLQINNNSLLRFSVTVSGMLIKSVKGPCLTSGEIAGIVVGLVLMLVLVAVGIYYLKTSKLIRKLHDIIADTNEIKSVLVMEGETVTLNSETKLQTDDKIRWMFGEKYTVIAETKGGTRSTSTCHGPDGRFKDRLELDHQTGSLTIMKIRNTHSGLYILQINRSGKNSFTLFKVSVSDPPGFGSMTEGKRLLLPMPCLRQRSSSSES